MSYSATFFDQDREVVGAHPRHHRAFTGDQLLEPRRDRAQQKLAGAQTYPVVDHREVVQVHPAHRDHGCWIGGLQHILEAGHEVILVGQLGQPVVQPLRGQCLLQQMQLGDVLRGDDVVGRHALGAVQQETREKDPGDLAAGSGQLALAPEVAQLATGELVVSLAQPLPESAPTSVGLASGQSRLKPVRPD